MVSGKPDEEEEGDASKPDSVLVLGDNGEDEPVFSWANKLQKSKAVDHVTTITLGSRSTEDRATLTRGDSGMFPNIPSAVHSLLTCSGVLPCLQQLASSSGATLLRVK